MRCVFVACVALAAAAGCGQSGNERKNDPGPPIQQVPGGPPPMKAPGDGQNKAPGQPKQPK